MTRIFHPNIKFDTGEICSDLIQNQWSPTLNARFILETIKELLKTPNLQNPLEPEIAKMYYREYKRFYHKAQE